MSNKSDSTVATMGIDIGKNSFQLSALIGAAPSCCDRSGHAAKSKQGSPTCRRAWSGWRRALVHITLAASCKHT